MNECHPKKGERMGLKRKGIRLPTSHFSGDTPQKSNIDTKKCHFFLRVQKLPFQGPSFWGPLPAVVKLRGVVTWLNLRPEEGGDWSATFKDREQHFATWPKKPKNRWEFSDGKILVVGEKFKYIYIHIFFFVCFFWEVGGMGV